MADWSQLPKELLGLIAKRLETCFDLVHFRSVCCSWRFSVPPGSRHPYISCSLPIYSDSPRYGHDRYCYLEKIPVLLFRFLQSSSNQTSSAANCWLVGISERTYGKLKLVSPLEGPSPIEYGSKIRLSTLNSQIFPLDYCYKVWYRGLKYSGDERIFSGGVAFLQLDKEGGDFAVLDMVSENLMMFRTTDMRWTVVENTAEICGGIVSFKGKFYAIDKEGRTVVIVPSLDVSFLPGIGAAASRKFLVQSGDELLLVEAFRPKDSLSHDGEYKLVWFRVFKLDEEADKWVRVDNLGGRVLFWGWPSGFCCLADEVPGLKGNSIIFHSWVTCKNTYFAFNLKDGSIRRIDQGLFRLNLAYAVSSGYVTRENAEEIQPSPPA